MPLSLFDETGQMRKTKKSILYDIFPSSPNTFNILDENIAIVVDGGFLMHRVVWPSNVKYGSIFECYLTYVKRHYGANCTVIFDGYTNSNNNIKSAERHRRQNINKSTDVFINESMDVQTSQEKFLSNDQNKIRLIAILTEKFLNSGVGVIQAEDDADTLIVQTAIQKTQNYRKVIVIGEDIDLIVLLLTLSTTQSDQIVFLKPGRGKTETRFYSIQTLKEKFQNMIPHFMFIHALSGCDTTSSIFQQGKLKYVKTFQKHSKLQDSLLIFNNESSSADDILSVGQEFLLKLFNAPKFITSLNQYRHYVFNKTVASNKKQVQLSRLPPTTDSAKQHIFRAYLQVQLWRGNVLNPLDWGWEKYGNTIRPIFTKKPPAPESLLTVISCACTKMCEQNCGCRKAGMKCSVICKHCQGSTCLNSSLIIDEDEVIFEETLEDEEDSHFTSSKKQKLTPLNE